MWTQALHRLFYPRFWLLLWLLFFWIQFDTTLFPIFTNYKLPLLLLMMAMLCWILQILQGKLWIDPSTLALMLCSLAVMLTPILSSLASGQYLEIFQSHFYRSLVAILLAGPIFYRVFYEQGAKASLLNVSLLGVMGLAAIFFYRFHILNEVREDGRPLLKISFGDPNFLATIFGCFIPLALMKLKQSTSVSFPFLNRFLALVCCCTFIVVVLETQSRMGHIALSIGLFGLWIASSTATLSSNIFRLCLLISGLLVILYGLSLADSPLVARFLNMHDKSNISRVKTMETGFKVFLQAPFFGVGMDSVYKQYMAISGYSRLRSEAIVLTVHNSLLKTLAEYGLFGLASIGSFYAILCTHIRKAWISNDSSAPFLASSLVILILNSSTLPIDLQDWLMVILLTLLCMCQRSPSRGIFHVSTCA